MKKISFIWMALLLTVASTALGQDVRYNFDKDTDFSKFKTYKWVTLKGATPVTIRDKQIKEATMPVGYKRALHEGDANFCGLSNSYWQ